MECQIAKRVSPLVLPNRGVDEPIVVSSGDESGTGNCSCRCSPSTDKLFPKFKRGITETTVSIGSDTGKHSKFISYFLIVPEQNLQ
jgi:hypothetical protein